MRELDLKWVKFCLAKDLVLKITELYRVMDKNNVFGTLKVYYLFAETLNLNLVTTGLNSRG